MNKDNGIRYQIQRRPLFADAAPFENYLKPYFDLRAAMEEVQHLEERQIGYYWKLLPIPATPRGKHGLPKDAGGSLENGGMCNGDQ